MVSEASNLPALDFFIGLESKVWSALATGDAEADERLLAKTFLGVYSSGFAGRADHASQLLNGPSVEAFSLSNARLVRLSDGLVLLSYLATWRRKSARPGAEPKLTYVTSIWKCDGESWLNVFSQDTKADDQR